MSTWTSQQYATYIDALNAAAKAFDTTPEYLTSAYGPNNVNKLIADMSADKGMTPEQSTAVNNWIDVMQENNIPADTPPIAPLIDQNVPSGEIPPVDNTSLSDEYLKGQGLSKEDIRTMLNKTESGDDANTDAVYAALKNGTFPISDAIQFKNATNSSNPLETIGNLIKTAGTGLLNFFTGDVGKKLLIPALSTLAYTTLQTKPQNPNITYIDPITGKGGAGTNVTPSGTTVKLDPWLGTLYKEVYDANKANLKDLTPQITNTLADQQNINKSLTGLYGKAGDPSMNLDAALAGYKSTTTPVTTRQAGITDTFGNLATKAGGADFNLDTSVAGYKAGMQPTMATQQGITDTYGNLATKAGGMTLDPAVAGYKGIASNVLGGQSALTGQLGNLTQQAGGSDLNLANALSTYQAGITPVQGTQADVLGKVQSLYGQAGANQGGYVQSVTDPVRKAAASAIGNETLNQGLRGIRGSSFGEQNLAAITTDAGRQIADATAKATQESLGLQSGLAGQELTTAGAQSGLSAQNLQAAELARQARAGQIGTQAGLVGATGGMMKDQLQTGAGILGAEQAGFQANMASLDEQAKLIGAKGQAAKDQQASLAALFGVDQAGLAAKVNQLTQQATLTGAEGQAAKDQLASAQAFFSAQQAGLTANQAQIALQAALGSQMSQSVKDQLQTALIQFQAGDMTNANLLKYIGVLTDTDLRAMGLGATGAALGATNVNSQNDALARLISGLGGGMKGSI